MALSFTFRIYFVFLGAAACSFAQSSAFPVSGTITDSSGAVVSRAAVKLSNRVAPETYSAWSDNQGRYAVAVPEGEYLLEVTASGLALPGAPLHVAVHAAVDRPLQLQVAEASSAVVVTATGTAQSLNETAKAIDTVDREQIDRRGIETALDSLRELPGVRISQRGGPGSFSTVQMRGLRSFDSAVLIDGMRFRDVGATQGDASSFLADLLVTDTARIEVLRGSGSSLYGTNATAGAINIVTDSGAGPFHGEIVADGGGLGSSRALVRFGAGVFHDRFHYSAGAGHQDVTQGVAGNGRYRNTTGNGTADYVFRPGLVLSGRLLATDVFGQLFDTAGAAPAKTLPPTGRLLAVALADSQIALAERGLPYALGNATFIPALGDPDYYRTARFLSALGALEHQVNPILSYRLSYQAVLSDRNVVNGPQGGGFQPAYRNSSQFNGRIDTLQGRVNLVAGGHQLLSAGYELERESFATPSYDENIDPLKRVNSNTQAAQRSHAFDAQDQIRLLKDKLQISLSGRVQRFALSKPVFLGTVPVYANAGSTSPPNAYTGDVSVAYYFRKTGTKIRTHGGNGYRTPSLYERFGTSFSGNSFTAYGDPRLHPERSIAIDGGVDQYLFGERLRLSGSYFYTRLQQVVAFDSTGLITPATDPFGRTQGYRNTSGGLARGVELSAQAKPRRSTAVQASYTYTNARDKFSQFSDGTLQTPRIYPQSFGLVILQNFGPRWDASLNFQAASDYLYPFSRRTFVFPGPRSVGLSGGYTRPIGERFKVRVYSRIVNAANQTFYEDGFRTPGIWAVGGFTFSY